MGGRGRRRAGAEAGVPRRGRAGGRPGRVRRRGRPEEPVVHRPLAWGRGAGPRGRRSARARRGPAVYRAGLVHDLGRVAVPTGVWERPGALRPRNGSWSGCIPITAAGSWLVHRCSRRWVCSRPASRTHGRSAAAQPAWGVPGWTPACLPAGGGRRLPRAGRAAAAPAGLRTWRGGRTVMSGLPLDRDAVRAVLAAAGAPATALPRLPAGLTERELESCSSSRPGSTKRRSPATWLSHRRPCTPTPCTSTPSAASRPGPAWRCSPCGTGSRPGPGAAAKSTEQSMAAPAARLRCHQERKRRSGSAEHEEQGMSTDSIPTSRRCTPPSRRGDVRHPRAGQRRRRLGGRSRRWKTAPWHGPRTREGRGGRLLRADGHRPVSAFTPHSLRGRARRHLHGVHPLRLHGQRAGSRSR